MAVKALAVANELLQIARANGANDVTPMKLQKLVYYAHGWHLAVTGKPLIDEQVEAWTYGPVINSIYHAAKKFGNKPVNGFLRHEYFDDFDDFDDVDDVDDEPRFVQPDLKGERKELSTFLKWIWKQYGKYSGVQLSNMTHEPRTPWDQINERHDGKPPRNTDIPSDVIRDYFREKYQQMKREKESA